MNQPSAAAPDRASAGAGAAVYAEVALENAGAGTFTYSLGGRQDIRPGSLVLAPLGPRCLPGVVTRVHAQEPPFPTRPLEGLLYASPLLQPAQLELATWLARIYRAPVWECVCLLLPPGLPHRLARLQPGAEEKLVRWLASLLEEPDPPSTTPAAPPGPPLTPAQEQALAPLRAALAAREHQVFLLHGVTGSGKTHVYLRAAEQAIADGGQVIVLVSEIALTPEAVERFSARFPGRVAVLHSGLTDAQRDRAWATIRAGRAGLVVGSRSAVFAPTERLRLIVVDEEHEWTYKQDSSPRYHARAVAIARARLTSSCVVLSSATPDVASYYHAERGRFVLLALPERYRPAGMPTVEVVDLRRELREGNRSIFSRSLAAALAETVARGQQAILFLNRRGAATCVTCRDCGHTLQCRRCEVPLAYHRGGPPPSTPLEEAAEAPPAEPSPQLVCHRCNRRRPLSGRCPRCGSARISFLGVGTQRVEQEARLLLPGARIERWDHDTLPARGAHERRWRAFAGGEVDVLIGTQMVAKALDVPSVTLVGAVLADSGLYLPDFRASERTFQLLTQVAGRAGRGPTPGRALIQTYSPDHYAVRAAASHDYATFYQCEIAFRRQFGYPPFRRLVRLVFSHSAEPRCWREAARVRLAMLEQMRRMDRVDLELLGPVPCFYRRVRGRYRWQLLLFGNRFERLLDEVPLGPGWVVDVDPMSVL